MTFTKGFKEAEKDRRMALSREMPPRARHLKMALDLQEGSAEHGPLSQEQCEPATITK